MFSSSVHALDNYVDYKGVQIGMTKDQINQLESVKNKYMPSSSDLLCTVALINYSKTKDTLFFTKKRNIGFYNYLIKNTENDISTVFDDIEICGDTVYNPNNPVKYKLNGLNSLYSDNIVYKFFKGKLFMLQVGYTGNQLIKSDEILKINQKLQKKFKDFKDINIEFESVESKINRDYGLEFSRYSTSQKDGLFINIFLNYYLKKILGIYSYKEYTDIELKFVDENILKTIENTGKSILENEINFHKKLVKKNTEKNLNDKTIKKELNKKYNY